MLPAYKYEFKNQEILKHIDGIKYYKTTIAIDKYIELKMEIKLQNLRELV